MSLQPLGIAPTGMRLHESILWQAEHWGLDDHMRTNLFEELALTA